MNKCPRTKISAKRYKGFRTKKSFPKKSKMYKTKIGL